MATERTWVKDAERAQCTICGENRWSFLRQGRDLLRPEEQTNFKLSRCRSCGHVMQTPVPSKETLRKAYSTEYEPYRPAWKQTGWPLWKILRELTTRRRMARLKAHGKGQKLLEVGSGAGDFLYAAHQAGWKVKAVEYNEKSAASLRSELGLDVRTGELRSGLWNEGEFDVVALWNVLEHVPNPRDVLDTACSYLKAGGLVYIGIPTLDATEQGNWFGQHWALLDLPRHLNFFGRASLSRICDQAGMDLILFQTPAIDSAWCYFASCRSYLLHSCSTPQKFLRLLIVGMRALFTVPFMTLRAKQAHGTEAFAIAVKRAR